MNHISSEVEMLCVKFRYMLEFPAFQTIRWKESDMLRLKQITWFSLLLSALVVSASSAQATDIGGTISSTLTITEDSQLVDDVTCTVTAAACIAFGASGVTLDLNGFTMTGLADPATACFGVTPPGGSWAFS